MSLAWASVLLALSLPFLLWPLLRHQEVSSVDEAAEAFRAAREAQEASRQSILLAIEEVELDEASGRLEAADAGERLAELRVEAERILRRP